MVHEGATGALKTVSHALYLSSGTAERNGLHLIERCIGCAGFQAALSGNQRFRITALPQWQRGKRIARREEMGGLRDEGHEVSVSPWCRRRLPSEKDIGGEWETKAELTVMDACRLRQGRKGR